MMHDHIPFTKAVLFASLPFISNHFIPCFNLVLHSVRVVIQNHFVVHTFTLKGVDLLPLHTHYTKS